MAGRRGRPRSANARSRATTRAGRRRPDDLGTKQLLRRRVILNGNTGEIDPLSSLLFRKHITQEQFASGRYYAGMVLLARFGLRLNQGSLAPLWRRLVSGVVDGDFHDSGTEGSSVDRARRNLARLDAELDGAMRSTMMSVCVDWRWSGWVKRLLSELPLQPGDWRALGELREGLERLTDLRTRRRREFTPLPEAAE